MTKHDWVALVLGAAEGKSLSPVQLQKSLFLIGKNIPDVVGDDFFDFIAYDYGPFDPTIYDYADLLELKGLAICNRSKRWNEYAITHEGMKIFRELSKEIDDYDSSYIKRVVDWVCALSFRELISSIYKAYPEYKTNSVFSD
jgi:hypothetical protein